MAQTETATLGGMFLVCGSSIPTRQRYRKCKTGYAGGHTKNPTYKDLYGKTGHAEVAQIKFDKNIITYEQILNVFGSP